MRLTTSKRYYVENKGQRITYYDLDKKYIPLAKAKCALCSDVIESKRCGDFVKCKCGKSFVDTDRWFPEMHRYGGEAKPI